MKRDSTKVSGRVELALNWIPENCNNLLDCGCSDGKYSNLFLSKSKKVYAIDPNNNFIEKANLKYAKDNKEKTLIFKKAFLENLPFENNSFDVITALEVIEHVKDEKKAIEEMHRVLNTNGTLILTTPNKGLFSFLDPDNYVYFLNKYFPQLYKLAHFIKKRKWPDKISRNPGYEEKHRHYSIKNLKESLSNKFEITDIFRSGLFFSPLSANAKLFFTTLFGDKLYSKYLDRFFLFFAEKEYRISFGRFSYYIAIKAIKRREND